MQLRDMGPLRPAFDMALAASVRFRQTDRLQISETTNDKHKRTTNTGGETRKPTWLAIIAGRARPDEPEVVGGVQEEGW